MKFPWYDVADPSEGLQQGDFIKSIPYYFKETKGGDVQGAEYDAVVMSQSCDLAYKKLANAILCPVWTLEELEQQHPTLSGDDEKEKIRLGNIVGYHLLNRSDRGEFKKGFLIVDFRSTFAVQLQFLVDFAKSNGRRLRLMPPYREYMSQAFGRFVMRIGLPEDIPPFR